MSYYKRSKRAVRQVPETVRNPLRADGALGAQSGRPTGWDWGRTEM
jgi:hypothetical protein